MSLELINPDDLPVPEMYTQVVVATGSKLVFVSGQQPEDIHGQLVGHGGFAAQARVASAISAEHSVRQVRGPNKCAGSQSTLWVIGAMNTFRSSKKRRCRCLEVTSQRTWWSG